MNDIDLRKIAADAAALSALAQRHGFGTLAYLLDMTRLEAAQLAAQSGALRQEAQVRRIGR